MITCKYCDGPIGTGKGYICRVCKEARTRYGMTKVDRDAMLEEQDHKCALCNKEIQTHTPKKADTANIDHCHDTERTTGRKWIRGLLCTACNKDLGGYERLMAVPGMKEYLAGGKEFGNYTSHRLNQIRNLTNVTI